MPYKTHCLTLHELYNFMCKAIYLFVSKSEKNETPVLEHVFCESLHKKTELYTFRLKATIEMNLNDQ